jgi:ABC-type multidrug transport system fused ATPase/permease subunit
MIMFRPLKSIGWLLVFSWLLVYVELWAQIPPGYVPASLMKKAQQANDSLAQIITDLQLQIASLNKSIHEKNENISRLDSTLSERNKRIVELNKQLEEYYGHNLQLSHSNRILIVFNSIVGFLLLVTLIWFVRYLGRKKPVASIKPVTPSGNSQPAALRTIESKLEQLERLSNLRDKGVLSEEEFNNQKQQILG